jgi:mRNA-degrading endonuclease toxin of MazEF toxin-antitoxin module
MRKRWLVAAGLVAVSLGVGAVMWTSSSGDAERDASAAPSPSASASASTVVEQLTEAAQPSGDPTGTSAPAVIVDPEEYAKHVAMLVFARDTRTEDVDALPARLLAEADPTLTDSGLADLVRMIDARVPDAAMWTRMRANQQWSEWQTQSIWEPGAWQQAVTSGYAEPGWTMRNVAGIEITHYIEDGQDRITSRERTISVLMRCPAPDAAVDRCHLAMLSTTPVA